MTTSEYYQILQVVETEANKQEFERIKALLVLLIIGSLLIITTIFLWYMNYSALGNNIGIYFLFFGTLYFIAALAFLSLKRRFGVWKSKKEALDHKFTMNASYEETIRFLKLLPETPEEREERERISRLASDVDGAY